MERTCILTDENIDTEDDCTTHEHEEAEFVVTWSMPFDAEGPIDAARQALGILQDPHSIATVFVVTDPNGKRFKVDLDPSLDEDDYEAKEIL